jgi:hypothetical protein
MEIKKVLMLLLLLQNAVLSEVKSNEIRNVAIPSQHLHNLHTSLRKKTKVLFDKLIHNDCIFHAFSMCFSIKRIF